MALTAKAKTIADLFCGLGTPMEEPAKA